MYGIMYGIVWSMTAMLRDSAAVVADVVRTHPRAMPLPMTTLFEYGAPLSGPSGRRSSAINLFYQPECLLVK